MNAPQGDICLDLLKRPVRNCLTTVASDPARDNTTMELAFIALAALLVSGLTLFSGFGLGTLLMPVFALFFPVPVAVAATAVVHMANNLFKLALMGRQADWGVVARFGLPAVAAALAGAGLLTWFDRLPVLLSYELGGALHEVTPVKAVIGLLIVAFSLLELSSRFETWSVPPRWLPVGGLLSGFFGGLSGNQGAFRAAFLIRAGLSKEAFVGTGVVLAVLVDTTRLLVYGWALSAAKWENLGPHLAAPVTVAIAAAFLGAWLGKRLLNKVTLKTVQRTVALFLMGVGAGLACGLI